MMGVSVAPPLSCFCLSLCLSYFTTLAEEEGGMQSAILFENTPQVIVGCGRDGTWFW
jgi:hypothetical protein